MEHGPRSAKGHRTRARLVEAGKTVFERDGFLQARISDIAAEGGVSHGAFYHYFPTKETLFQEVAEQVEARLISMADIPADTEHKSDPVERIRAANRSYLAAYQADAKIMRVIEEVSRYNEDVRQVRVQSDKHLGARTESSIARLQAEGLADPRLNTAYAAEALGGMVARFAENLFLAGGPYDLETAIEQLTILWANALGIRNSTTGRTATKPRARRAPARSTSS
jgi:AcrR family transcriptional regulator